jgi:hypothetical protein
MRINSFRTLNLVPSLSRDEADFMRFQAAFNMVTVPAFAAE